MSAEIKQLPNIQEMPKGLQIQTWEDLMSRAEFLSKSQLIPVALRGKPADVAIVLQMGIEVGLNPMQALNSIDVIQGKPAIKPEGQLALIYQKAPGAFIQVDTDDKTLTAKVTMARGADQPKFTATWNLARARTMGLADKENYKKQPLVMLKWRAIGEAARTVFPDIIRGMYNTFEAEDFTEHTGGNSTAGDIKSRFETRETKEVQVEVSAPVQPAHDFDPNFDQEPEVYSASPQTQVLQEVIAKAQAAAQAKAEQIAAEDEASEFLIDAPELKASQAFGKTLRELPRPKVGELVEWAKGVRVKSGRLVEFLSAAQFYLAQPEQQEAGLPF